MKISVVIPARNEEKYIGRCLQSMTNQTVMPDEIIVVDNNSVDATAEIALRHNARVVRETESGITAVRNSGFNAAQYEIIARTDSDSVVPPNWIERICTNATLNHFDILSGPITYPYISSPLICSAFLKGVEMIVGYAPILGPNMAITKSCWNSIGDSLCTNDKYVHEDFDLAFHASRLHKKVMLDFNLVVATSGRRIIGNPQSYFIEYSSRLITMHLRHLNALKQSDSGE